MKIRILSDLHADHHPDFEAWLYSLPDGEQDVVISAGDLTQADRLDHYLEILADRWASTPVIYVPGNHDYWYGRLSAEVTFAEAHRGLPNLFVLDNDVLELGGLLFVGATAWHQGVPIIEDLNYIQDAVEWIRRQEDDGFRLLYKHGDNQRAVAITHHLPHERSIPRQFKGHDNHGWYNPRLRQIVTNGKYLAWIHGHTHTSFDYHLSPSHTRVVCNPAGYWRRKLGGLENDRFNPCKIVEVE